MNVLALMNGLPLVRLSGGDADVRAITTDSRSVGAGTLFFAREGWFVDSHKFIPSAVAAGASAIVVTREDAASLAGDVPVFLSTAEDRDLGLLCDRFFGEPTKALKVLGVTGTNGKTSVSYMLEHALRELGERPAVIGTVTHRFESREIPARNTTPDGLTIHGFARECLDAGATCLILEVSSHGAVLERVAGVAFDSVGFTNLTADHLDFHNTFEAYLDAKRMLFGKFLDDSIARGKSASATVFADDDASEAMLSVVDENVAVTRTGFVSGDVRIEIIERLGAAGQRVRLGSAEGTIPVVGAHNVVNAAIASSMAAATTGASIEDALAALCTFAGIPGRFELAYDFRADEAPTFVDYAHSPDAVERALPVLHDLGVGATTCVLGCGGDRDAAKRPMMGLAAYEGADTAIFTSDNPRSERADAIIDEMLAGVPAEGLGKIQRTENRTAAIELALTSAAGPVLIAGKGHETYQEIGGVRFHLDDREEVRRVVRAQRSGQALGSIPLLSGWSAARIAKVVGGRVAARANRNVWGALTTDSRKVATDDIFVALRGERFDAHDFLPQVVDAGAGLIIAEEAPGEHEDSAVVVVDDSLAALQALGAALLAEGGKRQSGLGVVGITGSNGKTTTKELLAAVLGDSTLATAGNFNNHIGLPLTAVRLTDSHRTAVLEMGANGPDDIAELARIARPDIAVVTSVGAAHLEGFGDLDGVRRAKAGIVSQGARVLVLPHSEASFGAWTHSGETWTFGPELGATLQVVREDAFGPVTLTGSGPAAAIKMTVEFGLAGLHNGCNLAAALLAALATTGTAPSQAIVASRVAKMELPGGRLRSVSVSNRTVIDDAYNANPASMIASLQLLAASAGNRVAVLGEMKELGSDSDSMHHAVGVAAAAHADVVVAVGAPAKPIADGAAGHFFASLDAAAAWLTTNVGPGATLLLKASRGAKLERIIPMLESGWEGRS